MNLPPAAPSLPARLIDCASLVSDRYALLPLLPRHAVFAEIGVGLGDFSEIVMRVCDPALFVAIDEFRLHELTELWGRSTTDLFHGISHADTYRARFQDALRDGRMRVLQGDSAECLERLDDASLDIAYIDANHHYDAVRRDLACAHRKVRADGWIVLNDYIMVAELGSLVPYGVVHAAHEFMLEHDWGMQYLALNPRMFCDVALRPRALLRPPASRDAETERLRGEVAALRASTSWRATAPLRALASRWRARP